MSRWEKHRLGDKPGNQELVGESVGNMAILEEGEDGISLKLGCEKCGQKFWFDDKPDGRAAVVRQSAEGQEEVHAQCPKCGAEWDGDISYYYAVGYTSEPPAHIQAIMGLMGAMGGPLSGIIPDKMRTIHVFYVGKADDPDEAIKAALQTDEAKMPRAVEREFGIHVEQTTKDKYDDYQTWMNMKAVQKHADKTGTDLTDILRNILSKGKGDRFKKSASKTPKEVTPTET
jgi:hypothetical protein